jgi:hypothetical protein
MLLFALLWIAAPIFAYFLNRQSLSSWFTLTGMRRIHVVLMIVVIMISIAMFANHDKVRNQVGKRFVEGYSIGVPNRNLMISGVNFTPAMTGWR